MIEFGVMLGFLFVFLLAIFEWSQIFIKHYKASTICREAAVAVHQDCKALGSAEALNCLNIIRDEMVAKANRVFGQFETRGDIILTLYGDLSGQVRGSYNARITSVDPQMLQDLDIVVVSEFFYDNPLKTGMERLFSFAMPRLIYKSTII